MPVALKTSALREAHVRQAESRIEFVNAYLADRRVGHQLADVDEAGDLLAVLAQGERVLDPDARGEVCRDGRAERLEPHALGELIRVRSDDFADEIGDGYERNPDLDQRAQRPPCRQTRDAKNRKFGARG